MTTKTRSARTTLIWPPASRARPFSESVSASNLRSSSFSLRRLDHGLEAVLGDGADGRPVLREVGGLEGDGVLLEPAGVLLPLLGRLPGHRALDHVRFEDPRGHRLPLLGVREVPAEKLLREVLLDPRLPRVYSTPTSSMEGTTG